jgi:riboflavin-specific deaminase-like protein
LLNQLMPPGDPAAVGEAVEGLGLHALATAPTLGTGRPRDGRPYVLLNMVSTLDGRATLGGRSGALGNAADHELFHALRSVVDAVMVGAGTARAEHYGRLIRDESTRELRRTRGLAEEPLACIVSGRLALGPDTPLLADPRARVAILTTSEASVLDCAAQIEYVRAARNGRLDLQAALGELAARFGVRTLLCEGGPHLNGQLLEAGLVDELFLSLSPLLAGGDATGEALRILAGVDLDPPVTLELLGVLESESHLFLRYGVRVTDTR